MARHSAPVRILIASIVESSGDISETGWEALEAAYEAIRKDGWIGRKV